MSAQEWQKAASHGAASSSAESAHLLVVRWAMGGGVGGGARGDVGGGARGPVGAGARGSGRAGGCNEESKVTSEIHFGQRNKPEGYESCRYLKWLDDEWKGRSRTVIHKLAEENMNLLNALQEKDKQIVALKEDSKDGKCTMRQKIKSMERREFVLFSVVGAFAIVYVLSRVFV